MEALFGRDNLEHLRAALNASQANREGAIMEHLKSAMIDAGAKYVLSFAFAMKTILEQPTTSSS